MSQTYKPTTGPNAGLTFTIPADADALDLVAIFKAFVDTAPHPDPYPVGSASGGYVLTLVPDTANPGKVVPGWKYVIPPISSGNDNMVLTVQPGTPGNPGTPVWQAPASGLPAIAPPTGTPAKSPDEGAALMVKGGTAAWGAAGAPLATTPPSDPAAAAAVGTGTSAARNDHVHKRELPAHAVADKDKVLTVNASGAPVWSDVPKELPARAAGTADVNKVLAVGPDGQAVGWQPVTNVTEMKPAVANAAALPAAGATPANAYGDVRVTLDDGHMHIWVQGIAGQPAPLDADHWDNIGPAAASAVITTTVAPSDLAAAAAVGTSVEGAKADHVHKLPLATAAPSNPAATAAVGTGVLAARSDHVHKAELPAVTAADNDAILHVAGGVWAKGPRITMGTAKMSDAQGSDGDIHIVYKAP